VAKKPLGSSRLEKQVSVRAEDIFSKPLTRQQQRDLLRLKSLPDSAIDYSDIPPLSGKQLASAFHLSDKQSIIVRLDQDILQWLHGDEEDYSTRINRILRAAMIVERPT
jgi:uncharacterized protein (DUF4415 family)